MFMRLLFNKLSSKVLFRSSLSSRRLTLSLRNAEDLIGRPPSSIRLKLADNIKELVNRDEEILQLAHNQLKFMLNKQLHGTLVLLISKCMAMESSIPNKNLNKIEKKQRSLSEITEIIKTAIGLHRTVMNVDKENNNDQLLLITNRNKMIILIGDYLLASASKELANLYKNEVVDLIATAIYNMSNYIFVKESSLSDDHINSNNLADLLFLRGASLFAYSCQAACSWSENKELGKIAYEFGKNFGMAYELRKMNKVDNNTFVINYCDLAMKSLNMLSNCPARTILTDLVNEVRCDIKDNYCDFI